MIQNENLLFYNMKNWDISFWKRNNFILYKIYISENGNEKRLIEEFITVLEQEFSKNKS